MGLATHFDRGAVVKRQSLVRRLLDELFGLVELCVRHSELGCHVFRGVFAARTFWCLHGGLGGAVGLRLFAVLHSRVVCGMVFGVFIVVVVVFLREWRFVTIGLDGFQLQEVLRVYVNARVYRGHSRRRAETGAGEKDEVSLLEL